MSKINYKEKFAHKVGSLSQVWFDTGVILSYSAVTFNLTSVLT